jgi:hypothetical protein
LTAVGTGARIALTQIIDAIKEELKIMKMMKNRMSATVSIIALLMSMAVIGPDQAMAKDNRQRVVRSTGTSRRSSTSSRRRPRSAQITDGTSNTVMFGEVKGVISPRDTASGLPTGIVSNNSGNRARPALKGRRNHHRR